MLHDVPDIMLYMTKAEIISSLAYNMSFTLFETIFIFLIMVIFGLCLPSRWTRANFVPVSAYILTELTLMIILFKVLGFRPYSRILLGLFWCLVLILTALVVPRYPKLMKIARSIANHLIVLIAVYTLIDIVGVIIVIIRNV